MFYLQGQFYLGLMFPFALGDKDSCIIGDLMWTVVVVVVVVHFIASVSWRSSVLPTGVIKMVSCEGESIHRSPLGPPLQPTCAQAQSLPSSVHSSMPLHKTGSPKQPNEILIQLGTVHVSQRPFSHRLVLFSLPRHDIRPSLIAPLYATALK